MLAAKHFDPVLGIDFHLIQPPGPVPPVLIPHPFIGFLFDPFDYIPIFGSTIKVNGLHRAIGGTLGRTIPGVHFPIGGVFVKPPANECEMFMGSSTVKFDGDVASYMALPSLSCQDIGGLPPIRLNPRKRSKITSLVLPTSVVLPIPYAQPVLIGGPPTISLIALGMKLGMLAIGKGLKRLAKGTKLGRAMTEALQKAKQKAFSWMKPGWLKCSLLKGEPVNLVTGEVVVEQQDFELPGRIPLKWTRYYNSGSQRLGLCGLGWETPADARLVIYEDGNVSFHDGQPGAAVFEALPILGTSPVKEIVGGARLRAERNHLVVRTAEGLDFWFPQPRPGQREVPVQSIRDLCGNAISFSRDQDGLVGITDSAGRMMPVISNHGRIDSIWIEQPESKASRQLVSYSYNDSGDLTVVEDAPRAPYRFAYADHRLIRHTDRRKLSFYYEYDYAGRCIHAFGDGRLYDYHFRYYADAQLTEVQDSRGNVSVYLYNENRQVVHEWDPFGSLTEYEYDDVGRGSAVVDPLGRRTEYLYDESGNLLELKQANGTTFQWQFDPGNRVIALTDGNGQVWRNEWTETGQLSKRISPRGPEWRYEYNPRADLVSATNPLGHTYRFEVNDDGSTRSTIDPRNNVTRFEVDYLGNVLSTTDAAGFRTSYRYDEKSRLSAVVSPAGREQKFWWDAQDDLAAYRDCEGHLTRFEYFGLGGLARKIAPDGSTISYEYDTEENLIGVVNERNQRYRLAYDASNRISEEVDYWGHTRSYRYDAAGQVSESTDGAGRKLSYKFDLAGRLVEQRQSSDRFSTYQYDGNGNLVGASNERVRVERSYDPDGNLLEEAVGSFRVANEYDLNGNRILRKSSVGGDVAYLYDEMDDLAGVFINKNPILTIHRDARQFPASEVLSSNLQRDFSWDADGYLQGQQLRKGGTVIASQAFLYDNDGNLLERRDSRRGNTALSYDPLGRLASYVAPATRSLLPAPDLEQGPPASALRWQTEDATYEFDAAGNLAIRRNSDGETRFDWDANNRLVDVQTANGDEVRYAYDPLGRRLSKDVNGWKTQFLWDGDVLLGDTVGGHREFTFYPDSFVPLAMHRTSYEFYFQNDPVGLAHDVYSSDGALVWSARYGPFGDASKIVELQDNPLRLQGQYYDAETGLHYSRFRYFDPSVGSFISADPLGLTAGPDLYRYAPNVWNWIDPFGLICKIQEIHEDTIFKGIHINASNKVELKVLPGMAGTVVFKPVFSKYTSKEVESAVKDATADLANAAWRRKLLDTTEKATKYLVGQGAPGKSAETHFLAVALKKLGGAAR